MPSESPSSNQKWSMYPSLHSNVARLLAESNLQFSFHETDDTETCVKDYDTNIMGRFKCHNSECKADGWSSKRIAITIRLYQGAKYNGRVYHQRCKRCDSLSEPELDDSYAERVVYRIKKWQGIQMEIPKYTVRNKLPHNEELCEGCAAGHCSGSSE
jgi:hypothetical protein